MELDSGSRAIVGNPVDGSVDVDNNGTFHTDEKVDDVSTNRVVIKDATGSIIYDSGSTDGVWFAKLDSGETSAFFHNGVMTAMLEAVGPYTIEVGAQNAPNQVFPGGNDGDPWGVPDANATPPICFARDTMILTDRGEAAVENLRIGDLVVT